jgi:uncharacterized coiled-coil DUF342 family protein
MRRLGRDLPQPGARAAAVEDERKAVKELLEAQDSVIKAQDEVLAEQSRLVARLQEQNDSLSQHLTQMATLRLTAQKATLVWADLGQILVETPIVEGELPSGRLVSSH